MYTIALNCFLVNYDLPKCSIRFISKNPAPFLRISSNLQDDPSDFLQLKLTIYVSQKAVHVFSLFTQNIHPI